MCSLMCVRAQISSSHAVGKDGYGRPFTTGTGAAGASGQGYGSTATGSAYDVRPLAGSEAPSAAKEWR